MLRRLEPFAEAAGANLGQLALAWTFHQPGCTHVLVGARTPRQAAENAAAGAIELSGDTLRRMNGIVDELKTV